MSYFVVFALISASSVLGQLEDAQVADGSPFYTYFNPDAKAADAKLQQYLVDLDKGVDEYKVKLYSSANSAVALKKYNEVKESVKGTNCAVSGTDENHFDGAKEDIESSVKTCVAFVPPANREELKKMITKSLAKIQSIDRTLQTNSQICFSLRVPESQSCKDTKAKALADLAGTVSIAELAKFSNNLRKSFFDAKAFIDKCVDAKTSDLQSSLESWTKNLENCKASL